MVLEVVISFENWRHCCNYFCLQIFFIETGWICTTTQFLKTLHTIARFDRATGIVIRHVKFYDFMTRCNVTHACLALR